jgi:hypothetical protein
VTVVGSHLRCDCKQVIKASFCPRPILSPTKKRENSYYHCPYCKLDFTCSQAIKNITETDKYGYPQTEKMVCRKCETKLEKRVWPD